MCLWSAKPEHFNDPFDCDLDVGKKITEDDFIQAVKARYGDRKTWSSAITQQINEIIDSNGKFALSAIERNDREIQQFLDDNKNSGVVCLSEVNHSILMWSHYAQSHAGICVEFARTPDSLLGDSEICLPVEYSTRYPLIDIGRMLVCSDGSTINQMMRYKAECWAYEKEWRLITDNGDSQIKLPGKISKVIFGLRTKEDFRNEIQLLCDRQNIRTVQAIKASMEFRIVVPELCRTDADRELSTQRS